MTVYAGEARAAPAHVQASAKGGGAWLNHVLNARRAAAVTGESPLENALRIIQNTRTLAGIAQIQTNAANSGRLTPDLQAALDARAGDLGRDYLRDRTKLPLDDLSPAEERIVRAISTYVGIKIRDGSNANLTIKGVRNHGLIGAAEVAVDKATPTTGFRTLNNAGLAGLSYESIIVDHPEEFSARALWHARRTLGLPNGSPKAPARGETPIQEQTGRLLDWLRSRRDGDGRIPPFTNAEASAALGWSDLQVFGRAYGNLQSRLDFACYRAGLPPLGLTAVQPFDRAWAQEGCSWAFPLPLMKAAARARAWMDHDLRSIDDEARALPGQAHIVWRQEMAQAEAEVRRWAEGLSADPAADTAPGVPGAAQPDPREGPGWTREELILILDLYRTLKGSTFSRNDDRILELSTVLQILTGASRVKDVHGALLAFQSLDPDLAPERHGDPVEADPLSTEVWRAFSGDRAALDAAAEAIRQSLPVPTAPEGDAAYWIFVCNPKKWAIDRFLVAGLERDTWGVRPSDRERFAPGQLGLVRVGTDRRTVAEREGRPPLEAGVYALVEIESEAFAGTGASDAYWAEGAGRSPGWPTVRVRYLKAFADRPLTIDRLRDAAPALSPLLLNGFQAASFPIPEADFRRVLDLLEAPLDRLVGENPEGDATLDALARLEARYRHACPEVRERVSRSVERGAVGRLVKTLNGHRCQVCEALGQNPLGFLKPSGEPYVEAHHVMPVAAAQVGSLSASNILTVCANHHRQLHYGDVKVRIAETTFEVTLDGRALTLARPAPGRAT